MHTLSLELMFMGFFVCHGGRGMGFMGFSIKLLLVWKFWLGMWSSFQKPNTSKKLEAQWLLFFCFSLIWNTRWPKTKWNASLFSNSTHEMILKLSNFIVSILFRLFTQLWAVVSCSFADTHIIIGPYIGLYLFRNLIFRRTKSDLKVVKKLSTKKK